MERLMAAVDKPYEELDHTADLRLAIYGETIEYLFVNGATALFDMLVGEERGPGRATWTLSIEADGIEDLLVNWLAELLFRFEVDGRIVARIDRCRILETVEEGKKGGRRIEVEVRGDIVNPGECECRNEIKAVTYHQLSVRPSENGWRAEVVFDV